MNEYSKIDDYTLEVIKTESAIPEKELPAVQYDYGFLLKQRESIATQRDEMIVLKEAELDEVNILILEADKLGIVGAKSIAEPLLDNPI